MEIDRTVVAARHQAGVSAQIQSVADARHDPLCRLQWWHLVHAKLLQPFRLLYDWLKTVFVDGGYAGQLAQWIAQLLRHRPWQMEAVQRPKKVKGFSLRPKHWVVERTFARLDNFRRLPKYYAVKTTYDEPVIHIFPRADLPIQSSRDFFYSF